MANIERKHDNINQGFYDWFVTFKLAILKSTMLQGIREKAGLGSPPSTFTTNSSETINSIIKKHVNFKSHQLVEFVDLLKEAVDEQEHDLERAVIGQGKYRF